MKISNFFNVICLTFGLVTTCWALPWFQTSNRVVQNTSEHSGEKVNFSGIWIGQCNNSPAIDLTIQHDDRNIKLSYGFIEEKYILGEMKSEATTTPSNAEHMNTTASWNEDRTAVIFFNFHAFADPKNSSTRVFFSKVSMAMNNDQIVVKGQYYEMDSSLNDLSQDSLSCLYHRKP